LTTARNLREDKALAKYRLVLPYLQGNTSLASIAHSNGVDVRTVRRWLRSLEAKGFAGLIRDTRADRGKRNLPIELQKLIEGLFLRRPPMPISTIHRKIADVCKQHEWSVPSYPTVYRIVRALTPSLVTLAQDGSKAYKDKFDLVLIREADRANEVWQADHKELDILVTLDGKVIKPWLTAIIDDYSRAVPGYYIGADAPSVLRTSLAFRQGIWRKPDMNWAICGIPDSFYVDHGSDFTSRHLEQVAADLRVTLTFSEIGEPRGRGKIERFFRSVNQLLCAGLPGYLAPGAKKNGNFLTLEQFEIVFQNWLLSDYMQKEHSEIGMSPLAKWLAAEIIPNLPDSLEQLDLLLLTVKKDRSIRADGIHFNSLRYTNVALGAFVGYPVTIRYDPRDLQEIRVYLQGEFLCTASCEEKLSLKELIRTRNRIRKNLEREINARADLVRLYMESSGHREIPDGYESLTAPNEPPTANRLKIYAADAKTTNS